MRILVLLFTVLTLKITPALCSAELFFFSDTLVTIEGKVTNSLTDEAISAVITYEKLPYGDDMGIAKSSDSDGLYKMFMVKSAKYLVRVSANGYKPLEEEIYVESTPPSYEMEKGFSLVPIENESVINLDDLIFASGRSEISSSSYEELNGLVELLKEKPSMVVQLEGHTDFAGNSQSNMTLSQDRVESVKKYLTNKGIKKNRIQLKAFGGTKPITEDRSPEGRRMNRRVEVRVIRE
ncbi:MAG: OmpA family protein [Bacteroidota bacterium]